VPQSIAANNGPSLWQSIKNVARKIGNYIPTVCGGGVYNYVGGVGQATFNTGNETFLFGGVGGEIGTTGANLTAFGTSTGSLGLNLGGEFGPFEGGVGIYQKITSLTSCVDSGGR
jgi:hypothetical protein